MKKINELKGTSKLYRHGSWGASDITGEHEWTMTLYQYEDSKFPSFMVEWDIPSIEETEHIGLIFDQDTKELEDVDGIMSLPVVLADWMISLGYIVDKKTWC